MEDISSLLLSGGYIVLFFYSLGGGMVGLLAASVLATQGQLSFPLVLILAIAGNISGSSLLATLARNQKRAFTRHFQSQRRLIASARLYLKRYGVPLIFVTKFIYGMKTIIPLSVGLSSYSLAKFHFYNFFACIIWGLAIGFATKFATSTILQLANTYGAYVKYLGFGIAIAGFIVLLLTRNKRRHINSRHAKKKQNKEIEEMGFKNTP